MRELELIRELPAAAPADAIYIQEGINCMPLQKAASIRSRPVLPWTKGSGLETLRMHRVLIIDKTKRLATVEGPAP